MSEPPNKRHKMNYSYKNNFYKAQQSRKKIFLSPGLQGFLVTCNFREKDCVRDAYFILNEYADRLFPVIESKEPVDESKITQDDKEASTEVPKAEKGTKDSNDEEEEEEDISKLVQKEVEATKTKLDNRKSRFQQADTGAQNCLFIKADVPDVVKLAETIMCDLVESKQAKTKNILRLLPVEAICKANLKEIMDTAGVLFDKYLMKEPKTFAIVFNRRLNNNVNRDEVIKELADMVSAKNIQNKVDLKHAQLTVLVEVIKGHCCLSVLPDYFKLKKYNLTELVLSDAPTKPE